MTTETAFREDDNRSAIGRVETRSERIGLDRVAAMAALLDLSDPPAEGDPLPPGWNWLFFNPIVRHSEVGADGHPERGSFLPDVGLPRRMWAGGRVSYHSPLPVGAQAEKTSEILDVVSKSGRAGKLVFVTVKHSISTGDTLCIEEEQDIVYREAPAPDAPKPTPSAAPGNAKWSVEIVPDSVLLFRYSAMTSNGHRIHYDHPYATGVEGYPNLVVHGPLISTLLQNCAADHRPRETLTHFSFRGVAPLFVDRPFRIEAAPDDDGGLEIWAKGPDGELAMKAQAIFGA